MVPCLRKKDIAGLNFARRAVFHIAEEKNKCMRCRGWGLFCRDERIGRALVLTKCYKLKFGRKVDYFREWLEILIPQTADQHYLGGCAFFCPHVSHPLFLAIFVILNQNETNNETKKLEEVIFFMKPHRDGAQMCLSTKKQHFTN